MPPKAAVSNNARTAFKPPRPVKFSATGTSALAKKQTSNNSTSTERGVGQKPTKIPNDQPAFSDSENENNTFGGEVSDGDTARPCNSKNTAIDSDSAVIPPKLLARLLHEHFEHDDTRITKDAMALFGKYVDLFAKEAVARAINERRVACEQGQGTGLDTNFLEVEDLETLAPQLLLDFQ